MRKIFTHRIPLFLIVLAAGSLSGCRIVDPAEDIPSYIRVERIDVVNVNTVTQGTATHQITEAWVYVDNELIGGFELPAQLPVLAAGTHNVKVVAGVLQNGIAGTRAIYPYFKAYETTVNLERGSVSTLTPSVSYFNTVQFPWLENFDGTGTTVIDLTSAPFQGLFKKDTIAGHAFEGLACGHVHLTNDSFDCQVKSSAVFSLPATSGQKIYMEMHYRCDNPFVVGIITNLGEFRPWLTVNPSENWNKIYIDLTSTVYTSPIPTSYQVFIAMNKASTISQADLYFDNIKLLHF